MTATRQKLRTSTERRNRAWRSPKRLRRGTFFAVGRLDPRRAHARNVRWLVKDSHTTRLSDTARARAYARCKAILEQRSQRAWQASIDRLWDFVDQENPFDPSPPPTTP